MFNEIIKKLKSFQLNTNKTTILSQKQKTLKETISCEGVGLHFGKKVLMTLCPAPANSGIKFIRTDVSDKENEVHAIWKNVVNAKLNTQIANDVGVSISTIEHLMAALYICEIDNVIIKINAPEVPIMDGSASPFIFLIECAGIIEQHFPRKFIQITKPIWCKTSNNLTAFLPASNFSISFKFVSEKENSFLPQNFTLSGDSITLKKDVSKARTFGFIEDVKKILQTGLGKGGSLKNSIVINGKSILNKGGLRYKDEFVRHKVLDVVGDLYLAGAPLLGYFIGIKSGHFLNNELLKKMFSQKENWSWADNSYVKPISYNLNSEPTQIIAQSF